MLVTENLDRVMIPARASGLGPTGVPGLKERRSSHHSAEALVTAAGFLGVFSIGAV